MPPNDELEELREEVAVVELEAELTARRSDLAAGLVPDNVTRSLFDHELNARTNFAAIAGELDTSAETITNRLILDREAFLKLLEADLAAQETAEALVERIMAIDGPVGIVGVTGAKKLVSDAVGFHRGVLTGLALAAANRVRQEAAAQGVTVPKVGPKLTADDKAAIARQALRLAQGPLVDLVRAIRERSFIEAAR